MEAHGLRRGGVRGVVLDTNMLLVPYQFGVDVLEEIQRLLPGTKVYTIPQVIRELEEIERRGGLHERLGVRVARKLLERVEVLRVDESLPTDSVLVELAREGYVVATNDKQLKKRVWEVGGYVISLRERNHLELF